MMPPGTILVTGDKGYIGSVLTSRLIEGGYTILGFDTGYYLNCLYGKQSDVYLSLRKDIRDVEAGDLHGISTIIHLAGLSNDPLGELSPGITEEINLHSTLRLARFARDAGVKRFIYASSQSMYGVSTIDEELDEDDSEKNPITAYARTKWDAELGIKSLATNEFTVVAFRPSTVFGASPRLRCDIVFNNMVASAYTTGQIEIKSDGTPWRPVVHIQDVCSAFIAGIEAPAALIGNRSYNVGIPNGNFSVRELAEAAGRAVPGSTIIYTGEHGADSRTYKVGFSRILSELADWYQPRWNLDNGGKELVDFFRSIDFTEEHFRGRMTNRLAQLKYLSEQKKLNSGLRW